MTLVQTAIYNVTQWYAQRIRKLFYNFYRDIARRCTLLGFQPLNVLFDLSCTELRNILLGKGWD